MVNVLTAKARNTKHESRKPQPPLLWRVQGHRLNSPNDMVFSKRGDLYFSDPPYGLPLGENDPAFAIRGFGGVYRIRREAIESARASEGVAADPELVENGIVR